MIPSFSRLALVMISCFPVCTASAQQVDSMMAVYADRFPTEKIHIHFDKTIYNRQETVWYKIYILQSGETGVASRNIYLEWYDNEGKLIKQTVAPLYQSTAKGSFDIPADYKGESIRVKAFTRWMLNDDPAFGYEKELFIHTKTARTPEPAPGKTKVDVFPEGGFLVQGLNTHIAFKATNQFGHPVFIKAALVNDKNETLDSPRVKHDGMGSFNLLPLLQQQYKLNWTDENGVTGSTPIPVTKNEGACLTVKTTKGKALFQVERTVDAPGDFKNMVLLVHMNQVPVYQVAVNAVEKTVLGSAVATDKLPSGLLQFTLFTSNWVPVAERVIFINNGSHAFKAKITAPVINLDRRAKNVLEIAVADTLLTNMSLSITDADLNKADPATIYSDILLSSDIRGKVHNPAYYFEGDADDHTAADLDLVMLTHGWRRFDWDKIKAHSLPIIAQPAETGYLKMHGQVIGWKPGNGKSPAALNMIIVGKDSSRQFTTAAISKDGSFEQDVFFYDTARIYYNFDKNAMPGKGTEIKFTNGLLTPVSKKIQPANNYPFLWSDGLSKEKLDALLTSQELLKKKMAETTLSEVTVTTVVKTKEQALNEKYSTGFLATGEAALFNLTDNRLVVARNVLEYLQGKVAGLDIVGDRVSWRGDEPAFFLNEMRVSNDNLATITDIPMMDVAMIKVFRPIFMFATGGGRGGAIAVWTKKGGDAESLPAHIKGMEQTILGGYSSFREFYNPSYEKPAEGFSHPDNRTTLYWNPYVFTDAKSQRVRVEFFNNDFTKTFQVVLEGINDAGKLTRVVRTINADTKVD